MQQVLECLEHRGLRLQIQRGTNSLCVDMVVVLYHEYVIYGHQMLPGWLRMVEVDPCTLGGISTGGSHCIGHQCQS